MPSLPCACDEAYSASSVDCASDASEHLSAAKLRQVHYRLAKALEHRVHQSVPPKKGHGESRCCDYLVSLLCSAAFEDSGDLRMGALSLPISILQLESSSDVRLNYVMKEPT